MRPSTGDMAAAALDCDREPGLEAVLAEVLASISPVRESEVVAAGDALGRVTAVEIRTPLPLPPFDHSAVDGYGIATADIGRAGVILRVVGQVAAGARSDHAIGPGEAARLLTGAPIPAGVAAVLFEERCRRSGDGVQPLTAADSGANIRRMGEDVGRGEVIVEAGTVLDARHLALLAAAGVTELPVVRRLAITVLSNGDELREPGAALPPGMVHDCNRPMLLALLAGAHVTARDGGLHRDDAAALTRALADAASADLVICSGGASGSDTDHVERAILRCGGAARRARLQLKPGKPIVLGRIGRCPVLGLPGNPVAAMVNFLLFGRPAIRALVGARVDRHTGQAAVAAEPIPHHPGRREFLPARIVGTEADGRVRVAKLGRGGSARLRPLALADGLVDIAAGRGDVTPGEAVAFHSFAAILSH